MFPQSSVNLRSISLRSISLGIILILLSTGFALGQREHVHALDSGIEVTAGDTTLRVEALRDDVLRITEGRGSQMPEASSWAVLADALSARVHVTADRAPTGGGGFHTASLAVVISPDLRLTIRDAAGQVLSQDAAPIQWQDRGFTVAKVKMADDHFFGLGDKPGPLDHAGMSFTMWNTDNFGWQESTDPHYKSIPFFIEFHGGQATGTLLDNTWRTNFDFGHSKPAEYAFGAVGGPATYYFWTGPDPKKVVETYAWLTGKTPLPPMWSLGFQQSRYSYETEAQLMTVANRLRADHIPADALYMDIDYQLKNRPFTVNPAAYPDLRAMMAKLKQDRFHVVMITDLHIANLPNAGYMPYDTGVAGDEFVKMPDGSTYTGKVWPGPAVFPDFTMARVRTWWGGLYKQFVADGASGFWNDMNEPAVFTYPTKTMPDDVQHRIDEPGFARRTASHLEIHNVYGMENSRATYDGVLALRPDERPFVLTRASYAGGQRYSATWTGDNSSTWNHLRMTVPQLENLGLSGFALSGADVGGFAGSPSPELLTKWIEVAAFQPIDRDHAAKGTRDHEPWVDGPQQEAIRRRFIEERYRLMPYLYTVAEEMSRTGLPMMRPLFLEFPHAAKDGHPLDNDATGEFMVGDKLLVAASPSPEEVAPYEVHLPPGEWFNWWTGVSLGVRQAAAARDLELRDAASVQKPLMVTPKLEDLPVYVRAGAIVPIAPLVQSTDDTPQGPLTLRIYVPANGSGAACEGSLYQDDGHSFAFRAGEYLRMRMTCSVGQDGALTVHFSRPEGTFKPWFSELRLEVFGFAGSKPQSSAGVVTAVREGVWSLTLVRPTAETEIVLR